MKKKIGIFLWIVLFSTFEISIQAGGRSFTAYKATSAPVIDGIGNDTCWQNLQWYPINVLWQGSAFDSLDFYGRFKVSWNSQKLFVLVEVNDNILSDQHSNPLDNYYNDDCVELFIDENHSGGDHQYNFNAFAYHVSTLYDVVDLGSDGIVHLYNDNIHVMRTNVGDYYTWEFAVNIYDASFVTGGTNIPEILTAGKVMGFSIGYCDNDSTNVRESFIGTDPNSNGNDNHWINASEFATLTLLDTTIHPTGISEPKNKMISIYPNPAHELVYISFPKADQNDYIVHILNTNGQVVKNSVIKANSNDASLFIGELQKGIYFIEMNNNNTIYTQKLIIQ